MQVSPREKGLVVRAAVSALGLGAWFFLTYGFGNWWTSQRAHVGTLFWDWEKAIPFVPAFIVPYMSIDLFFVGAFFLCRTREELRILNRRLFADITLSVALFLLFPLQLGVIRPVPTGCMAPVFTFLHAGDLPYNLAPSLHISLRSLLWITYGRHLRGRWRQVAKAWFILVGLSTLLTWQHHLFDVASGFVMAWMILFVIPDPNTPWERVHRRGIRTTRHSVLAQRYGVGAVSCAACMLIPEMGPAFAWPGLGLAIVSLAYFTANPRLLQKSSGTLSPAVEWILLPVQLVRVHWQRRWMRLTPAWHPVTANVWFGRMPLRRDVASLLHRGFVACVDLTAESNFPTALRERLSYLNIPILDLTLPAAADVHRALSFIQEHETQGKVLIHCQLGLGRSALVAAAWLLQRGEASTADAAMEHLARRRPGVIFTPEAHALLAEMNPQADTPAPVGNQ